MTHTNDWRPFDNESVANKQRTTLVVKSPDRVSIVACLVLWTSIILFSSSGVAGHWADTLYAAIIARLSDGLGREVVPFIVAQKLYHVALFAVFGWLLVPVLRLKNPPLLVASVLVCFFVGAASESVQLLFSGRGATLADVALDGLSGAVASILRIR